MTLLGRWPRPKHSNDHVMTENVLRCCLRISSASCGLAACDCVGRAAPSSSSRWQRSRRTCAGWPSSSPGRHRRPPHVGHSRCGRRCHRVKPPLLRERGSRRLQQSLQQPSPSNRRLPQQNLPGGDISEHTIRSSHRFAATTCRLSTALGLRNVSADAPGSCRQRERTVVSIAEQTLAYASFELLTAVGRQRHHVSTAGAAPVVNGPQ